MHHPVRLTRLVSALAVAMLAAPVAVLASPATAGAATAAVTRDRADAAAGWLTRQLDPATHTVLGKFGPDYGLTADVVLALDAAGSGQATARAATRALSTHVLAYTAFGDPKERYAGAFAKLLVVSAAQKSARISPRAFGAGPRKNLVAGVRALECGTAVRTDCSARDKGRFADISAFGDFSNTFGQSLALIGLQRTTSTGPSSASIGFLRKQQCADGSFPESFHAATCTGSVDATGFAVQALTAVGGSKASSSAQRAGRWLRTKQHADGSFTANGTRNANTTGIAAQALAVLGRDVEAAKARIFLRHLQVLCGGKAADRGKVRYDRKGGGEPVRATAQAVPALAGTTLADVTSRGAVRAADTLAC